MIAYLDSSVVLRFVLRQDGRLAEWERIERAVTSALMEVECLRALDRLRLRTGAAAPEIAERRAFVHRLLERVDRVEPSRAVLDRASQPFPTSLRTLDAIHLATALLWRERTGDVLTFATHGAELALAARASGLTVIGV